MHKKHFKNSLTYKSNFQQLLLLSQGLSPLLQKYFYASQINSYDFKMLTVIDFLSDMNNWLPSLLLLVYFVCFKNLCFLYSLLAPATSGQVSTLKRGALTASLSWGTTDRQS